MDRYAVVWGGEVVNYWGSPAGETDSDRSLAALMAQDDGSGEFWRPSDRGDHAVYVVPEAVAGHIVNIEVMTGDADADQMYADTVAEFGRRIGSYGECAENDPKRLRRSGT